MDGLAVRSPWQSSFLSSLSSGGLVVLLGPQGWEEPASEVPGEGNNDSG